MNNFKEINIGKIIEERWKEMDISITRTCQFFKSDEETIFKMFNHGSIDTKFLIKWSKLLEYDFFRIYTQHLLLYSPKTSNGYNKETPSYKKTVSSLPQFRKNIYTQEIIFFILQLIQDGEKTKQQVIEEYGIPKTTLYKWISKYQSNS